MVSQQVLNKQYMVRIVGHFHIEAILWVVVNGQCLKLRLTQKISDFIKLTSFHLLRDWSEHNSGDQGPGDKLSIRGRSTSTIFASKYFYLSSFHTKEKKK